jgi:hypothetical protein
METKYDWIISALDCRVKEGSLENVVNVVHWRLNASNDKYTAETYSATGMPEPSGTDFTLYADLTKEQVVGWVISILSIVPEPIDGEPQISQLEQIKINLNKDLYLQEFPVEITPELPFNN